MVVWFVFFSCFVFFLLVLVKRFISSVPVWGVAGFLCLRRCALAGFSSFFSRILKLDLCTFVDFYQTRATQLRSPSSSAPAAGCIDRAGRRNLARGSHAPGSLHPLSAREGQASPFQAMLCSAWVPRRQIPCWVPPVTACVIHAPPFRRSQPLCFTAGDLFWVLLPVFVYSPCLSRIVCFCIA
jgi:hypothetical protein